MGNYVVRKYGPKDLCLLKNDWLLLENGKDMSYFQTYDWYVSINDVVPEIGEVVFFEVIDKGKVILIAPLWILKKTYLFINKRGVYFWGRDGYSDYLNFIYSEFDGKALDALFVYIQNNYGVTQYYLEFLQEGIDVVRYLEKSFSPNKKDSFNYAAISLPDNVNEYMSILSKHSRQNLRTAYNRMVKDGLSFKSSILEKEIDGKIRKKCEEIRKQRLPFKKQTERKQWALKTKVHMFFDDKLRIHFPYKSVVEVEKNGNLLLVTHGDEVAAFFYYGYEEHKKRVVVMTAGTNIMYARYSPGFYFMFQQIKSWIEEKTVEVVDFTRGGEQYKFFLGCEKIPVCNMSFQYK